MEVVIYDKSGMNHMYAGDGLRKLEGGKEGDQLGLTLNLVFSCVQSFLNIVNGKLRCKRWPAARPFPQK